MIRYPGLKSLIKRHIIDRYYAILLRRQAKLLLTRSILNQPLAIPARRPRLLMLPDVRGWAFDELCRQRAEYLSATWDVTIRYVLENPVIDPSQYDLMFNPNQSYSDLDSLFNGRYIRGFFSLKWARRNDTPVRTLFNSLQGAVACAVPSLELGNMIRPYYPATFLVQEGIDPNIFHWIKDRNSQNLVAGWTGNPEKSVKRFYSVVKPACKQAGIDLLIPNAPTLEDLNQYYNNIDVVIIASEPLYEGNPMALFEAGACGRTVIATRVGTVPEIVTDGKDGFIIDASFDNEKTINDIAAKLSWCAAHMEETRIMGKRLMEKILAERIPERTCETFRQVVELAYSFSRVYP